ncbi:hypothetical protein [Prosthecobacter sp.]|jgi:hypothetical protein|uniref:hypothetical protein n=1 Tax=Prosthecobacter sp. TaxID=1965333 RepID=UPI00378369F4
MNAPSTLVINRSNDNAPCLHLPASHYHGPTFDAACGTYAFKASRTSRAQIPDQ